ncbi:MAG: hypothetical protein ACRDTV_05605 [Mycobacterium sp.]
MPTWRWRMPIDAAEELVCVIGQVALSGAVLAVCDAQNALPEWKQAVPPLGDDYQSIRAATAEITWLILYGERPGLDELLARRYGVPVGMPGRS